MPPTTINPAYLTALTQAASLATTLKSTLAQVQSHAGADHTQVSLLLQRMHEDLTALQGAAGAAAAIQPLFRPEEAPPPSPSAEITRALVTAIQHQTGTPHQIANLHLQAAEDNLLPLIEMLETLKDGNPAEIREAATHALNVVTDLINNAGTARLAVLRASIFLQALSELLTPPEGQMFLTDELLLRRVRTLMDWKEPTPQPSRETPPDPVVTIGDSNDMAEPVLFVDDDPDLPELFAMILTSRGFQNVVTAQDARSALAVFSSRDFAVIVTDFIMPEMNGLELAREIWKRQPNEPIVFVSGNVDLIRGELSPEEVLKSDLIPKPVDDTNDMVALIRKIILGKRR